MGLAASWASFLAGELTLYTEAKSLSPSQVFPLDDGEDLRGDGGNGSPHVGSEACQAHRQWSQSGTLIMEYISSTFSA